MDHTASSALPGSRSSAGSALPGGVSCLAIAYPAIAATGHARLALAAGTASMAVLLLTWVVLVLLRRINRFHYSAFAAILTTCAGSSLVWLGMHVFGWIPESYPPLPLLAAPVLLLFEVLPILQTGTEKWNRHAPTRLFAIAASAAAVYLGVGIVREWVIYGSVFASSGKLGTSPAQLYSIPIGTMVAGLTMAGVRWMAGCAAAMMKGGRKG